ncbi:RNA polymerase Rpc34 subunit [Fragilaria crotonensis]|nr:RNA polymerase Rpc34 subunit [Fragilaria crotonensis]
MPPRTKRAASSVVVASASSIKRAKTSIKTEPIISGDNQNARYDENAAADGDVGDIKERFIQVFEDPNYASGIANSALKLKFGDADYLKLVPVINDLTQSSRLIMSKVGDELFYNLVSDEVASKFIGLDVSARMVYQVIEKSGNLGIWTKDIRTQTNIQQQALNKIFKALETRRLIKPVKSVSSKKVYMLYNLTPAKELTGGPWYTELEFDHEFINEMRKFLLTCVRRLNNGQGVTLTDIKEKLVQANVSKVQLSVDDVQQLMQTLAYDHLIEDAGQDSQGETLYVAARRVTPMCEFKWWDAISPDFHFRKIRFEDGVELEAHEPHHHTA